MSGPLPIRFLLLSLLLIGPPLSGFRALTAQATASLPGSPLTPEEERRIGDVFTHLDNTRSPGCAVGVLEEGELAFARGYGMANLDHGIAITPRTIFRIGSVSKQFTSTVVVLLAQEGAFSLDDEIRTFFPEIPEYDAPITVRHLLHHTSGIRDYLELMSMRGVGDEAAYSEEDVVKLLARQKALNFTPGSDYAYSNSGYLLLSRLVERATGRTLREEANRLLFGPLGMELTHFHDDHREIVPSRATGYDFSPHGTFVISQTTLDIVGDGGVFTSIEEMARWMANFWTLEVGGEVWLRTLEERGILSSGDTLDYALGLRHGVQRGLDYVGHGGSFVGYRAATLRYPEEETAVMVLCNYARTDPMDMALRVGAVLLEDRMEDPPEEVGAEERPTQPEERTAPLTPGEEAALLGEYYSEELDAVARIFRGEAGLAVDVNGGFTLPLQPLGPHRFRAEYITLTFQEEGGNITSFRAGSGRARGLLFVRR